MDQNCGRSYPIPVWGSSDADGDRASKFQHTVERMDGHVHLGRSAPIRAGADPPPVFHVLRTRNLDRLRPSPIICLNRPMAASARARLVVPEVLCQAERPCSAMRCRWRSRCVGAVTAVSLGTAEDRGAR